jgi:NADH:ubiquinone oxidoreductase subunit F (NADH-binding)
MPNIQRADLASFYHHSGRRLEPVPCAGTACFVARHLAPTPPPSAPLRSRLYCLGKCYAAPSTTESTGTPRIEVHARRAVLLERIAQGAPPTLANYRSSGGYDALSRAFTLSPQSLIGELAASGLRGRGGAAYPTHLKVAAVAQQRAAPKYVVMNADEGDPGAYIDRMLLERDPHACLEGPAILARAVGATRAFIYLRREYPGAEAALRTALAEATAAHLLGPDSPHGLEVELVIGAGSYVCGEETALLNALEGTRPFVRSRPPYPASHGLHGAPTLVQNVETLANVPWILRHGGAAYAEVGSAHSRGIKLVSLNSLFARPGLYEVELGTPLREVVETMGGGLRGGELRGVMVGGPLAADSADAVGPPARARRRARPLYRGRTWRGDRV